MDVDEELSRFASDPEPTAAKSNDDVTLQVQIKNDQSYTQRKISTEAIPIETRKEKDKENNNQSTEGSTR